jgi:hypothetical protein
MKTNTQVSNRFNLFPVILFAALVALMTGCQSVPEASSDLKQQALSFTPPSGMAGLYVIRPYHFAGAAVNWTFRLDYQDFGSLETKSYLYSAILPGKHFLRQGPVDSGFHAETFVAKPGQNYYFLIKLSMDPFLPIPEAEGQKYVREFKMSGANCYKVPFNP